MSTKIYNGYRIDPSLSPGKFVYQLREKLGTARRDIYRRLVIRTAVAGIDAAEFSFAEANPSDHKEIPVLSASEVINKIIDEAAKNLGRSYFDLGCEVTLIWDDDESMYALLFTQQDELRQTFEEIEGVSDFSYWDNADRPNEIGDEEWDRRRLVWDRILGCDTAAERGVTFEGGDLGRYWFIEDGCDLSVYIPTKTERAEGLARAKVRDEHPGLGYEEREKLTRELAAVIEGELDVITTQMLMGRTGG